jgi:DNA-directed RNA polymerase subunit RPC12/RpoP
MKKWFCTDCGDTFNDEKGERCPMCGFRRVIGPVKYANAAECREAIHEDPSLSNGERGGAT